MAVKRSSGLSHLPIEQVPRKADSLLLLLIAPLAQVIEVSKVVSNAMTAHVDFNMMLHKRISVFFSVPFLKMYIEWALLRVLKVKNARIEAAMQMQS